MSVLGTHLASSHTFTKFPQESITLVKGIGVKGDAHAGKKTQHLYFVQKDTKTPGGRLRNNDRQVHLIQSELFEEEEFWGKDGQRLRPGQMGENITTTGIDLLALGKGTKLRFVEMSNDDRVKKQYAPMVQEGLPERLLRAVYFDCFAATIMAGIRTVKVWCVIAIVALFTAVAIHFSNHNRKRRPAVVELTGTRKPCKKIDQNIWPGLSNKFSIIEEGKTVGYKAGVMGVVKAGGLVRPGMSIIVEPAEVFEKLTEV